MIDKDIERGKVIVNSEKSHVGAGRPPISHEKPFNSGIPEGGNETVPGGKVGKDGSMQRERRTQDGGDTALDQGEVAEPHGLQVERNLACRHPLRLRRATAVAHQFQKLGRHERRGLAG